jgi:hypothetical protein
MLFSRLLLQIDSDKTFLNFDRPFYNLQKNCNLAASQLIITQKETFKLIARLSNIKQAFSSH